MTTGRHARDFLPGLAVHAFTASGAGFALLALMAAVDGAFANTFGWLAVALFVDGIDGTLARHARVDVRTPWIDGALLDLVVDFVTYVFVPVVALWRSDLLPPSLSMPIGVAIVTTSALYFSDRRMKTTDNWFRGFPTLWNVLAFHLFVFALPPWVNAALLTLATVCQFLPVVFVHPLRVRRLRTVTLAVTIAWFCLAALAWSADLHPGWLVRGGLLACAVYFLLLPLLRPSPWAET
jgi:phosphatidylcholine synthase